MADTPQQKWKSLIIAYRKKCQKILGVSKSVRYTGVINEYGRTLTGIIKPGIMPLWNSEQIKNENDKLRKDNLELKKQLEKNQKNKINF